MSGKRCASYGPACLLALVLYASGGGSVAAQPLDAPPPKREFRAAWVATVNNIDWPKRAGLSVEEQKASFVKILDDLADCGFNAVVVQVRPAADAFYKSYYEPWSQWLNGKQGQAPEPFYDPLAFMVEEAHKRHLEFHAWVNPYRAVSNIHSASIDRQHVTKVKPQWFLTYGQYKIFDPGLPEVRQYLTRVILDIVARYDVDGLHFDDYFYPYPDGENLVSDGRSFYKHKGAFRRKADWRRHNVNLLIESVYKGIQKVKPHVKFGVSPFGVWRNQSMSAFGSRTRSGYTSYDHLHADVRHWLEQGWLDYVAPQLYQNTVHRKIPFKVISQWWDENNFGKHVYIGHAAYRLYFDPNKTWYDRKEMPRQVRWARKLENVGGSVFYNYGALRKNQGSLRDSLRERYYRYPALPPTMPWKDDVPPNPPEELEIRRGRRGVKLRWKEPEPAADGQLPNRYVVYKMDTAIDVRVAMQNPVFIRSIQSATDTGFADPYERNPRRFRYVVTALDRLHNESAPALYVPPPAPTSKPIDKPYAATDQEALRLVRSVMRQVQETRRARMDGKLNAYQLDKWREPF